MVPHAHTRPVHFPRPSRNGTAPRRKVVLVLEDHASVGGLIAGLVRQEGYRAVRAWDVREATRLAKDRSVDAVVLDLNLAYPDGLEVLKQLATQGTLKQAPVVLVTGGAVQPSTSELEQIREVVRKPFDIDVMLNAVRGAVGDPVKPVEARHFDEQDYFLNGF